MWVVITISLSHHYRRYYQVSTKSVNRTEREQIWIRNCSGSVDMNPNIWWKCRIWISMTSFHHHSVTYSYRQTRCIKRHQYINVAVMICSTICQRTHRQSTEEDGYAMWWWRIHGLENTCTMSLFQENDASWGNFIPRTRERNRTTSTHQADRVLRDSGKPRPFSHRYTFHIDWPYQEDCALWWWFRRQALVALPIDRHAVTHDWTQRRA